MSMKLLVDNMEMSKSTNNKLRIIGDSINNLNLTHFQRPSVPKVSSKTSFAIFSQNLPKGISSLNFVCLASCIRSTWFHLTFSNSLILSSDHESSFWTKVDSKIVCSGDTNGKNNIETVIAYRSLRPLLSSYGFNLIRMYDDYNHVSNLKGHLPIKLYSISNDEKFLYLLIF